MKKIPNQTSYAPDYHIHSNFSCDAEASMEAMCQASLQAGLKEIGISDHFDLHPNEPFKDYLDLDGWWQAFERCKRQFAGDLVLRAGVEIGEPHLFPERVEQLTRDYPWDYILGSLHWVGDICVFEKAYFESGEQRCYAAYFQELERMVEEGQFDILAHFDVVKRYGFEHFGPFLPERHEDRIRRIVHRLAELDRALEINTSTLRRSIQQPSPDATILRWFLEEGGRYVTLGSDAHTPLDIGFGFRAMKMMVKAEGVVGLARYESREVDILELEV